MVIIDFTFILRRIAKETPGRFLSPRILHLGLALFLWTNYPRLYED